MPSGFTYIEIVMTDRLAMLASYLLLDVPGTHAVPGFRDINAMGSNWKAEVN
jgi:hypothetical protein